MALPKWWTGKQTLRNQNRSSATQERARAEEVGGRVQSGSGSSWRAPQDVVAPEYLEQLKETNGKGFTILRDECAGLLADALRSGREPRMVVDFRGKGPLRLIITIEKPSGRRNLR